MKLVRVVAPHFVAAFITDGTKVVKAAPILSKRFIGLSEDQARQVIAHFGWKASVIADPEIIQHQESFEVRWPGGRRYFYYDDNEGRRAISGRMTCAQALVAAQAYLKEKTT